MYSELNSIPEGWLKASTDNTKAIENKVQKKSIFEYQDLMHASFNEFYRVLKPGKWMTVEFSNTSAAIWNSIQYSWQAGFIISNITDLDKKRPGLTGMIGPVAVKQDLVITCYSLPQNSTKSSNNIKYRCSNIGFCETFKSLTNTLGER